MNFPFSRIMTKMKPLVKLPHAVRGAGLYATALLIAAIGRGLWLPFSLLYFNLVIGLPLPLIGAGLTGAGIVGLVSIPVAGSLVDRFGARLLFFASFSLLGIGSLVYLTAHTFSLFLVGAALISSGFALYNPSSATFLADLFPREDHDWWLGFNRSALNLGLGLGVLLTGWAASIGGPRAYAWMLLISAVGFFITGALVLAIPVTQRSTTGSKSVREEEERMSYFTLLRDRPFLGFIASQVVFFLGSAILEVALPPFLVVHLHAPTWGFSLLYSTNTLMVVALQVPLMPLLVRFRRTRGIVAGGFGYVCSYLLFAATPLLPQSFWMPYLMISIIIYTLAEMFLSPTSFALALTLAPERMRGRYMAVYGLTWTIAWTLAPTLFTALLTLSPSFFWLFFAALTSVATFLILLIERWLPVQALHPVKLL